MSAFKLAEECMQSKSNAKSVLTRFQNLTIRYNMYITFDLKSVEIEKLSCLSIQRFFGLARKKTS